MKFKDTAVSDLPVYVTGKEIAHMLHITEQTLIRYVTREGLPCHQMVPRGRRLFKLSEVEAWVQSRCTYPTPASKPDKAAG